MSRYTMVSQALWGLGMLLAGGVTVWLAYGLWRSNLDGGGTLFVAVFALLTYWCFQRLFA